MKKHLAVFWRNFRAGLFQAIFQPTLLDFVLGAATIIAVLFLTK